MIAIIVFAITVIAQCTLGGALYQLGAPLYLVMGYGVSVMIMQQCINHLGAP